MASHRKDNMLRKLLNHLPPKAFWPLVASVVVSLAGALLWFLLIGYVGAIMLAVSGLSLVALETVISVDQERDRRRMVLESERLKCERVEVQQATRNVYDLMASKPGGAPLVADIVTHCGCTHRYMFESERHGWDLVEILEHAPGCCADAPTLQLQEVPA